MNRASGYFRLTRPLNCIMMGVGVLAGAILADFHGVNQAWIGLVYGFTTGFMLTAASMTINDYYDRKIDAINEPKRPIPSGLIKPKEALVFALILSLAGFVAAYLIDPSYPLCFATGVIAWMLFVGYTTVGKRSGLPGNFLVSACVAIPFVFGSIVMTNTIKLNVLLFASMAFLSNTGREITKGIVDVEGDKTENVKTLAVRYGSKSASIAAALFYLTAVALSPLPWFMGLVSFWFIPFVAVTDIGLIASSFILIKDHSREQARKIKKIVLLWFVFGLLAFITGAML
jgi:geranylgeranylglycerol-phosphate geranylgeranyltransferase